MEADLQRILSRTVAARRPCPCAALTTTVVVLSVLRAIHLPTEFDVIIQEGATFVAVTVTTDTKRPIAQIFI